MNCNFSVDHYVIIPRLWWFYSLTSRMFPLESEKQFFFLLLHWAKQLS